jgi:hypothetical protein
LVRLLTLDTAAATLSLRPPVLRHCLLNLNRPTALAGLVRPYPERYIAVERTAAIGLLPVNWRFSLIARTDCGQ